MVAEGDRSVPCHCHRAGAGQCTIRLRQCGDACVAPIDVQNATADVQRRAQAGQGAVDRRRAVRYAGRAGNVVGAVDRRRATAAELDVLCRDARDGIDQMGATTEADRSSGAGEVTAMGTTIGETEDAGLNIDRAGVVEGDSDCRRCRWLCCPICGRYRHW